MQKLKPILSVSLVAALLMASTACKSSPGLLHGLVLGLQVTVDAATVAISVISAADPNAGPALKYAQDISNAASLTITELNTADTSIQKINKSVGYFEAVIAPNFPAGTQRLIVVSISAITQAVELFLTQLHNSQPPVAAALAAGLSPHISSSDLSRADSVKLKAIEKQAKANAATAK